MELKSLKRKPDKAEDKADVSEMDVDPAYPWGTQIDLDNESLEALGVSDMPDVGGTVMVTARATVDSVRSHKMDDGSTRRNVCLQITDMALGADEKPRDLAQAMYGDKQD